MMACIASNGKRWAADLWVEGIAHDTQMRSALLRNLRATRNRSKDYAIRRPESEHVYALVDAWSLCVFGKPQW
jgi:hypothetical protein